MHRSRPTFNGIVIYNKNETLELDKIRQFSEVHFVTNYVSNRIIIITAGFYRLLIILFYYKLSTGHIDKRCNETSLNTSLK